MFRIPQDDNQQTVTITIEGNSVSVPRGMSVAAAVLVHGVVYTRTSPVSGAHRAPLCMMGVCYECLMVIDGRANRRACQETVAEGMTIERQIGTGNSL